ncbi:lactonase family protein [Paucibacter sp. B2R-40]|uniref:lactonase family protein n=1 Tax=Paucibacter sp. B2R-40 TaxID=2893554 RepID=UPI0021E3D9F7|nr:lactonase family protein [Paucibacter sp. B2R-40]MCV2353436.1 lactonase family protein [Paucibacter sp. B2R-40]
MKINLPAHAYVGSYSPNGLGIYSFEQDPQDGSLRPLGLSAGPPNPSWLCARADGSRLYAANEFDGAEGGSGQVTVYARDATNGALTLINSVGSGGASPAHLSLSADERFVFVANYGGGSVAVLPVAGDGSLCEALTVSRHGELFGAAVSAPQPAALAVAGSFAISGHDGGPHAHMAQLDPRGRFLLVSDLGLDLLISWRFDARSGQLSEPQTWCSSIGAGPRHFAFHPQRAEHCYVLNEEASTLAWLQLDVETGRLTQHAEVSSLPLGFKGTSFASDLRFSADGRYLYCLNRLHDSVAIFAVAAEGSLTLLGHEWTRGSYPRSFAFDPSGRFLYVCNQRSDHLAVFEVQAASGGLEFTGHYVAVGSPAAICFTAEKSV